GGVRQRTATAGVAKTRASHWFPVFSLIPNRAQTSAIAIRRFRHAWTNCNRSDMGELSRHATGASGGCPNVMPSGRTHPSCRFITHLSSRFVPLELKLEL